MTPGDARAKRALKRMLARYRRLEKEEAEHGSGALAAVYGALIETIEHRLSLL